MADTADLLTSEIVTNVIRHVNAGSGPRVRAAVADGYLEIGVVDGGPERLPHLTTTADPGATGGRGLAIVDALASEWGTMVLPATKEVWFRLEVPDWSYRSSCRCRLQEREMVVLGSGRPAHANEGPWDDHRLPHHA